MSTPDAGGGQRHRRLLGLWRNPSVRREIADTRLLIAQFMESGWASSAGQRSIAQMNHIHAHYRIDNEDFLFVLWTFIDFPLRWLDAFGWRRFTAHERQAWFHYWVEIGRRMRLQHIPGSPEDFDAFVQDYEARQLHHAPANERVAQATIAIMAAWLPKPLRGAVAPVVRTLVPARLLPAIGMQAPSPVLKAVVRGALKLRALAKRGLPWEAYPTMLANTRNRTYPGQCYRIEELGPPFAHRPRAERPDQGELEGEAQPQVKRAG